MIPARHRLQWPGWRTACYLAGVTVALAALALPVEGYTGHMTQHALLVGAAAPLVALGSPVALVLAVLPREARRRALAGLRSRPARALGHPLAVLVLFVGTGWALHAGPGPSVFEGTAALHSLGHVLALVTATLFFCVALARGPWPRRLDGPLAGGYLLMAMPGHDLIGLYLLATGRTWGGVAMLAASLPIAAAGVVVAWRALLGEEREQQAREALA